MAPIVQAECPGCKKVLRIPAEWMHQVIRCKHCGMVASARPTVAITPISPASSTHSPSPASVTSVVPSAPGAVAPTAGADALAALDADAEPGAMLVRRRRSRSSLWSRIILSILVLAVAAGVIAVCWPRLKELTEQAPEQTVAQEAPKKSPQDPPKVEKVARKNARD